MYCCEFCKSEKQVRFDYQWKIYVCRNCKEMFHRHYSDNLNFHLKVFFVSSVLEDGTRRYPQFKREMLQAKHEFFGCNWGTPGVSIFIDQKRFVFKYYIGNLLEDTGYDYSDYVCYVYTEKFFFILFGNEYDRLFRPRDPLFPRYAKSTEQNDEIDDEPF